MEEQQEQADSAALPDAPLTFDTWEEWEAFVSQKPVEKPSKVSRTQMSAMTFDQRKLYNQSRVDYHNSFGPILTPDMRRVHEILLPLIRANLLAQPGARRGAVIDGEGTVGKTTILANLGKQYELEMRERYTTGRTRQNDVYKPVAYVTLRGATTIKGLSTKLAKFYNTPYPKGADADEITDLVVNNAKRCATTLLFIDDIHYLKPGNKTSQDVNNHIKDFANSIAATIVVAGIDVKNNKFFTEGLGETPENSRKSQTRRRFTLLEVGSFKYDEEVAYRITQGSDGETPRVVTNKDVWMDLLKLLESNLVLGRRSENTLLELDQYLWSRTGGFISALCHLVRRGANMAIENGSERITKSILETILLDQGAEEDYIVRSRTSSGLK
ncbi:hypothetical protein Dcar01_01833 [Deinococcus carri]|uniref:AAA+ ATPase domain-containing protein n=1 Tax=Deinococcus carri TaxID=1211323 RepID=A0ABP9W6Z0_9DEIO